MNVFPALAAVIGLLATGMQPAFAARPLATDDAGVIAGGDCEVELGRTQARLGGARESETAAALACGVGFGSQLSLGHGQARHADGRSRSLLLAAKGGLWAAAGEDAAALALAGAWGWDRAPGQGWERGLGELRLIGTLPLRHAFVHANLGHARTPGGAPRATTWGLALEHQPLSLGGVAWAPLAEVYGDDRGERWLNAGVRATVLPERLFLDLAHARQQAPEKARVWNAGLRWAF